MQCGIRDFGRIDRRSTEVVMSKPDAQTSAAMAVQAKLNQGVALHQQGKLAEAERCYNEVMQRQPNNFDALHLLGVIALQTQRTERGIQLIKKAIGQNTSVAAAYNNLGNGLKDLKRPAEALASYDKAIALKADYAEAYNARGNALKNLKRLDEAIASYDKAIALKADYAEAYNNRGNALKDLKRLDEAIASYDKAIALNADYAGVYNNHGIALKDLKRLDEAIASYDKAIALKADYAEAYGNRGNALRDLKRLDEAIASYDKAIVLNPDLGTEGVRFLTKMQICDWRDFDTESKRIFTSVKDIKKIDSPFSFAVISASPEDQLQCAKLWVAEKFPPSDKAIWQGEHYKHDRIRIAYVSADFRVHPTSFLMAGVFECHDKSCFEVMAISFGPDDNSEIRQRLKASFERFVDVSTFSDDQIANLAKTLEIDVLIDLMGFTGDSRTGILARRPAPIQVSYLGYPGTIGASYIDYIIADQTVIPDDCRKFYSEKIVALPNTYQANDRKRVISNKAFARSDLGLPSKGFVFCCFNNSYKIMPSVFDCWMRILKQVEGSVLWLLKDNASATINRKKEAVARGVGS